MGIIRHVRLVLAILLPAACLVVAILIPATVVAAPLPSLNQAAGVLAPATGTVQGTVSATLGSVDTTIGSLGSGNLTLPSTPPIDVGGTLGQTIDDVNGLGLPVQLPQVDVPLTVPGVDTNQVVGGTLQLLDPGSTAPGSGSTLPTDPGSTGGTGATGSSGPGASGANGVAGAAAADSPSAAAPGAHDATAVGAGGDGNVDNGQGAGRPDDPRVTPAAAGGGLSLGDAVRTGFALLPLLGALCAFLASTAYLKSARNIWNARA